MARTTCVPVDGGDGGEHWAPLPAR